jgi:diguanylate cyclase (GGDEF)-like protein
LEAPQTAMEEGLRIKTLCSLNILDTSAEDRFDRLTRTAKRLFEVPIAIVSLVDENRQWFKSCVGLKASETPRDISFCGHAILDDGIFIIPDALEDKRFADNPLVTGAPNIRFYAGCPLSAPNGQKLGTLCIIDHKPRTLSVDDQQALRDLTSMAEREIAAIHIATIDDLTQIPNRRGLMQLAEYCLHICRRQNTSASLIYIDLKKFKLINDKFGHAEGDVALVAFADLLKNTFRDSDLLARLGGDEFVVLLSNKSKHSVIEALDRFKFSLDDYNKKAKRGYNIEFSYGIVDYDAEIHQTIDKLLADGDSRMYQTK